VLGFGQIDTFDGIGIVGFVCRGKKPCFIPTICFFDGGKSVTPVDARRAVKKFGLIGWSGRGGVSGLGKKKGGDKNEERKDVWHEMVLV